MTVKILGYDSFAKNCTFVCTEYIIYIIKTKLSTSQKSNNADKRETITDLCK